MLIKPKREVRITRLRRVQQKEEALGAKGTGPAGLRVIRDKIAGTRGRIQKRLNRRTKRKRRRLRILRFSTRIRQKGRRVRGAGVGAAVLRNTGGEFPRKGEGVFAGEFFF